jgi:glucose/arabinose dehydrogenase
MNVRHLLGCFTLAILLQACGGDESAPPTPPPPGNVTLAIEQVFGGLPSFSEPVLMLQEPASTARWYVVQKAGIVYVFDNQPNVSARRVFVNVSSSLPDAGGERGLLGMAFHPNFPINPRVYLSYTANDGSQLVTRVVEYQTRDSGQTLDASSALVVLQVYQPQGNHNGGHIAFGPDGFLYVGRGDGGGGGDQFGTIGNGQRLSTLLGKLLRIDVNATTGATRYAIPSGNPFAASQQLCNNDVGSFTSNCPEIYAYGFRNPWRWSFDRASGELWLGDVGQNSWEEINRVIAGGNYGWRCREGAHAFNATCGANAGSSIDPVAEYGRADGISVTGGFVYRGTSIPALVGRYVFGDFGSGRIWHIARDTAPTLTVTAGLSTGLSISSFAQDAAGEIYVVHFGGTLHRLR